ncbi:MAG TPA: phospholipid carrier-dependent glycosyltransferase [Thermomicrobiales bacterium]|nr:phospholipid carrier-dependent glycosyltransferase [Thermomicrobiales bacterium]
MSVLPARQPPGTAAPAPPGAAVVAGGALDAGVLVVAVGGLALALATGTRALGPGVLALYALTCTPAALAAALWLPRLAARSRRDWLRPAALAAVALAGAALRFHGLGFALPYVPHPDEPAVVNIAQRMLVTGDLDPHRFTYPSLYIELQAAVYALHLGWGFTQGLYRSVGDLPATTDRITTAPGIFLWGRALTATLATGAILLTYGAGRRLYGPRVGLIAALLLAFAPATIADAHLITVDVPAAAFTALAFYWIVALYRAPLTPGGVHRWWPIARAGIGVGLAAATKYNAALIVVPLGLVPLLRGARAPWRVWLGGALAAGATFLAVTPYALPELPTFLNDTAAVIVHYEFQGHGQFTGAHNWRYYAAVLWHGGRWTSALALGGLVVMALRHRRADLLALPFPLLYYGALAALKVNFTRNLLPLDPFLALAGAVGLLAAADGVSRQSSVVSRQWGRRQAADGRRQFAFLARHLPLITHRSWLITRSSFVIRHSSLVALVVLPIALAGPASSAGQLDNLRATTDTRVAAQRWMAAHLSRDLLWLVQLPPQAFGADTNLVSTDDFGPPWRYPPAWYPAHGYRYLLLEDETFGGATDPAAAAWAREARARFPVVHAWPGGVGPGLLLFDTGAGAPPMRQPRDARFGDEIALRGFDLGPVSSPRLLYAPDAPGAVARAPRPGDTLGLTLALEALRPPRGDYQLFVHLRDAGNRTVAQRDTPPRAAYPTTAWRPGSPVLVNADLALPANLPPGRYTVVIGLYSPGGSRLPARAAPGAAPLKDDELPLATIEVGR